MPSIAQFASLSANIWTWTGNGYLVGANLYFPAAGYHDYGDSIAEDIGGDGYYWSSTVISNPYIALLNFSAFHIETTSEYGLAKGHGCSVRCVAE